MKKTIILLFVLGICNICYSQQLDEAQLSQPKEATITIPELCIDKFDEEKATTLWLYFLGNPRWKQVQGIETMYSVRKEIIDGKCLPMLEYSYTKFDDSMSISKVRALISFEGYSKFYDDDSNVTYIDSKSKASILTIKKENSGLLLYSSNLLIKGENINIEIFEQSKNIKREYTEKALVELNEELSYVLQYNKEINNMGIMPINKCYPIPPDSIIFNILDGYQPGMYDIQAGLKIDRTGTIYMKVFDDNTNKQLSSERITPKTTKDFTFSKTNSSIFQYKTSLTVYEGDWKNKYEARFEIWFKDKKGNEKKLIEKKRLINGWQR